MTRRKIGFVLGLAFFLLILLLPPFGSFDAAAEKILTDNQGQISPADLAHSMRAVLALMALMVIWWLTEAIPLPATALLPAAILPVLHITGIHRGAAVDFTFQTVVVNYANPVIFLFLGGFLIAASMQKWKLDRRFALWLLTRGTLAEDSRKILFGMMLVTAFISMWISNTATTAMMLPLGVGLLSFMGLQPGGTRFGTALMLGIAWSASIGGMGTIIGTPPNGIALGILNTTLAHDPSYRQITFLDWMKFGVPYVLLFLPIAWFVLLKVYPPEILRIPGGKERLSGEYVSLGRFSRGEKGTIAVFFFAALLWILSPFREQILPPFIAHHIGGIDEYAIGLAAGVLLFLIPTDFAKGEFLLDWRDTKFVDWGVLILFGGGIALSDAIFKTGLGAWIAASFVGIFGSPSTLAMMFIVVILIDFLTEVTSNTAVTSMMVPVVIAIAQTTGGNPVALTIATALAASMAYMLPVGTPPNALVYGTGYIALKDMIRAGFILDILGWLFTVGIIVVFASWIFGIVQM